MKAWKNSHDSREIMYLEASINQSVLTFGAKDQEWFRLSVICLTKCTFFKVRHIKKTYVPIIYVMYSNSTHVVSTG